MKPIVLLIFISLGLTCCSTDKEKELAAEDAASFLKDGARVIAVKTTGNENAYSFEVTIESADTGCEQYADWWEIVDLDGHLIYRRILTHSHVDEQPFSRTGTNIQLKKNTQVYVRAHMNATGYSTKGQKGSVESGFIPTILDAKFANDLEKADPLPSGCEF
ncbi:hypothetical protein Q4603_12800 [Zobellia galactanivorans]|uniref:Conserved hypothetical lipoprotein n=1 Tax=Zobellia galactanivorans (strain DSM 12802 / CCUG 47099 / CIP 106680 / NCIMB 13871 / Dsij) TaxID=63186 RepID=G0L1Z4_ZOBGA|nr:MULTISPECIES: hypothetical protein [Zobellia]MBU3027401.1 hypothetical protein [Zobellia galactanivorans]MDO6809500.1 hypothetical protein [Zobellia galactanivorans]OWW24384.1 hypothetical protein B4Q04_16215 [Zobellia sp. OII3]CAZ94832.1 Conserved hypothetical lipoprotein [Zobellia galactanivorans]